MGARWERDGSGFWPADRSCAIRRFVVPVGTFFNFDGLSRARGAPSSPRSRAVVRPEGCGDGGRARRGQARRARGSLTAQVWQLRLCNLRRTAGCRRYVTPGTARQRQAVVTPADYPAGTAILAALHP
jgi:hypothetical protein